MMWLCFITQNIRIWLSDDNDCSALPKFFPPLGTMACSCSQLRLTFLQFVVTMFRFEYVYSYAPARPPRVSVTTFTSYICCIYALKFGQYWTSFCLGNSSVSNTPYIQFLFVRPRLCRGLPSDSTSRWTPLPVANSSYCQVCSGLSPPSDSACRAHKEKSLKNVVFSKLFWK